MHTHTQLRPCFPTHTGSRGATAGLWGRGRLLLEGRGEEAAPCGTAGPCPRGCSSGGSLSPQRGVCGANTSTRGTMPKGQPPRGSAGVHIAPAPAVPAPRSSWLGAASRLLLTRHARQDLAHQLGSKASGGIQANAGPQLTFGVHLHHGEGFSACDAAICLLQTLLYHGPAVKPGGTVAPGLKAAAPTGMPNFRRVWSMVSKCPCCWIQAMARRCALTSLCWMLGTNGGSKWQVGLNVHLSPES